MSAQTFGAAFLLAIGTLGCYTAYRDADHNKKLGLALFWYGLALVFLSLGFCLGTVK